MKKLIVVSLVGLFLTPMLSFTKTAKTELRAPNHGMMSIIAFWFEIPADNATTSWVKVIDKPTPNNPKAMKNAIYFDEQKITFINRNGVGRDYINEAESVDAVRTDKEKPRLWKIPNPNMSPKDENDFVATFQIFQKGIVLTLKEDSKSFVFTLKA